MRSAWCVAILAAVVLTGCSADNQPGQRAEGSRTTQATTNPAGGDEDALRRAVRAYSDAYLAGDGTTAHAMLSARCRQRISRPQMDDLTRGAKTLYGPQAPTAITVERLGDGQARVTYTYPNPAINQTSEPWVLEDGTWRQDDC